LFAETSFGYKQTAFLITLSVYKMFKKIKDFRTTQQMLSKILLTLKQHCKIVD